MDCVAGWISRAFAHESEDHFPSVWHAAWRLVSSQVEIIPRGLTHVTRPSAETPALARKIPPAMQARKDINISIYISPAVERLE